MFSIKICFYVACVAGGIVWPLVTASRSNLTRLYYNGSAAKSHSTTTQYRQLRRLVSMEPSLTETLTSRNGMLLGECEQVNLMVECKL